MSYILARHSLQLGTFGEEEIREGVTSGRFLTSDLAWREGMPSWEPLSQVLGLAPSAPPFLPPSAFMPGPPLPPPQAIGDDAGMRLLLPVGRSGWAIAAGYLGLFGLVILPAPLALIVSLIAIRDIKKSKLTGKRKYGMGRAIFGLIVGILGTGVILTLLVGAFLKR